MSRLPVLFYKNISNAFLKTNVVFAYLGKRF